MTEPRVTRIEVQQQLSQNVPTNGSIEQKDAITLTDGEHIVPQPEFVWSTKEIPEDFSMMSLQAKAPITTIVRERVAPAKIEEFTQWVHGISQETKKHEGNLGVRVMKENDEGRDSIFVTVFTFDCYENLMKWLNSEERKEWVKKLDGLVTAQPRYLHGFAGLFRYEAYQSDVQKALALEDKALKKNGVPLAVAPARWKMFIVIWVWVYAITVSLSYILTPHLLFLPLPVVLMVTTILSNVMTVFFLLPMTTKVLKKWLFKPQTRNRKMVPKCLGPYLC